MSKRKWIWYVRKWRKKQHGQAQGGDMRGGGRFQIVHLHYPHLGDDTGANTGQRCGSSLWEPSGGTLQGIAQKKILMEEHAWCDQEVLCGWSRMGMGRQGEERNDWSQDRSWRPMKPFHRLQPALWGAWGRDSKALSTRGIWSWLTV